MTFDMHKVERGLVAIWHQSAVLHRVRRHPLNPCNRNRVEDDAECLDELYRFTNHAIEQMEINNDYCPRISLRSAGAEPSVSEVRNA